MERSLDNKTHLASAVHFIETLFNQPVSIYTHFKRNKNIVNQLDMKKGVREIERDKERQTETEREKEEERDRDRETESERERGYIVMTQTGILRIQAMQTPHHSEIQIQLVKN